MPQSNGKLGHGGVEYIARVLACDPKTIRQGLHDLEEAEDAAAGRIRKQGGRPRRVVAQPTLEATLRQLRVHRWRSDARRRAVDQSVAARVVATAVGIGYPRQSAHNPAGAAQTQAGPPHARKKTMGHHPDRNAQFENIARLRLV